MRFNRFVIYLLNLFIIILLLDFTLCLKKKNSNNRGSDYDSEPEARRSAGLQNDYDVEESSSNPDRGQRGRGPDGRGPPGQRNKGRGRNLPPGLAKKQNNNRDRVYEETTVRYEDDRNPVSNQNNKNKNKNKNKPNRGNSGNNSNNNDDNYADNRPQTPRPHRPRPHTTTEEPASEVDIPLSEWRSMERLKHHWQNTAHTKSALSKKFIFFLERDADYQRHDACLTPENKLGNCHYIQHCPIPDVIRSFDKFLSYACFIHNRYVGICCPDDYLDDSPDVSPQRQTATTRRPQPKPQQQKPNRKPQNSNDNNGSDYNNGVCGLSENTRIIGGALADPKDWLWMAALILKSDSKPYCGGAVITNQHILTAAHCLTDLTPDDVIVRLGAYDFSASADPEAQDFAIEYFKIHNNYNRITNENDLAIIKLRSKTVFTDSIKPICLPQRNRDYAGHLAIVTGWGHTSFGGKGSPQLRQVSLPVWNNTSCDSSYSVAISDNMLCAGNNNGGKDSCQGDSGGPLMLQGPNKRWMIIGVVSWGVKCGQPNYPGVYTRISKYIDWVKANSKDIYK